MSACARRRPGVPALQTRRRSPALCHSPRPVLPDDAHLLGALRLRVGKGGQGVFQAWPMARCREQRALDAVRQRDTQRRACRSNTQQRCACQPQRGRPSPIPNGMAGRLGSRQACPLRALRPPHHAASLSSRRTGAGSGRREERTARNTFPRIMTLPLSLRGEGMEAPPLQHTRARFDTRLRGLLGEHSQRGNERYGHGPADQVQCLPELGVGSTGSTGCRSAADPAFL